MRWLSLVCALLVLAGCLGRDSPAESPTEVPSNDTWIYTLDASGDLVVVPSDVWVARAGGPVPLPGERRVDTRGWEPTLAAAPDGSIFVHGWMQASQVMRTDDGGETWRDVSPQIAGRDFPPNSQDPILHVDPVTGRLFKQDLQGYACFTLAFSDDGGDSWTANPVACGVGTIHDRQTLWTATPRTVATMGYPNVVHYCAHRQTDIVCSRSLDGGLAWSPERPLVFGIEDQACDFLHSAGRAGPDGTLYLPKAVCGRPSVAISKDDGLTWTVVQVADDPLTAPREGGAHSYEVSFAVDAAGNAYMLWIGHADLRPYVAVSTDGGTSWGKPFAIAPPGVETTAFPTLSAGDAGKVVALYYGSPSDKAYDAMSADDEWNAYMTAIVDAIATDPLMATVMLNSDDDPLARGRCGGALRCPNPAPGQTEGGVGDFLDIIVDPSGRPWAAYVDVCHGTCKRDGSFDGNELVLGTWLAGPALRGNEALAILPVQGAPPWSGDPHTRYGNGTLQAQVSVPATAGVAPERSQYVVGPNATSLLFEARWTSPQAGLWFDVYWGRTLVETFGGDSPIPGTETSLRVASTDPALLAEGRYLVEAYGTLAFDEPFATAVTVFYGQDPEGFSALT